MKREFSRRDVMQRMILAGAWVPALEALAKVSDIPDLTPLDPKDVTATALGFVPDAANAVANANFHQGEHCGACAQFQGKPSDPRAACKIYAGHTVPAAGWCLVWTPRPG